MMLTQDREDKVGVTVERLSLDSGGQRRLPRKVTFPAHEPALKDVGGSVEGREGRNRPFLRSLPSRLPHLD